MDPSSEQAAGDGRGDGTGSGSGSGSVLPDLIHIDDTPRPWLWRAVLFVGAGVCFVGGVVLWITPVLTGIPLYIVGAVLLSMASPAIGHKINAWEATWPRKYRLWLRPKIRKAEKERVAQEGEASSGD